jgi:hypothetical protein
LLALFANVTDQGVTCAPILDLAPENRQNAPSEWLVSDAEREMVVVNAGGWLPGQEMTLAPRQIRTVQWQAGGDGEIRTR